MKDLNKQLLYVFIVLFLCPRLSEATERFVEFQSKSGQYELASSSMKSLNMLYDNHEYKGVIRAINDLQADIYKVTDIKSSLVSNADGGVRIIIGSVDSSCVIRRLIKDGKIEAKMLVGKHEKYIITSLDNPIKGIKGRVLVIVGSDKRGTIYGIYELSKQIGVSPWYWWADVPVEKHNEIYIKNGTYTDGEPAVKYRGVFINDEWPCFGGWTTEKYGGFNSKMYVHLYELILRLKGNFLWPAMWSAAFYADDPQNSALANEMGIIVGTSHHEPMGRNYQEWARHHNEYGQWNYQTNQAAIDKFFREGIERMKKTEDVVTVGMRGEGDAPMETGFNKTLLETIFKNQRNIIESVTKKPAAKTPQVWALYSEVLDYYDQGIKVPDDVMILLCDDNWGDVRRLPILNGAKHPGGYGMYYHVDLHGAPRCYQWLNMTQIQHMWEQLQLTYDYGVDKMWILNVGDLKPNEFPTDFFMNMAWNPKQYNANNLMNYTRQFCAQQFGEDQADEAAGILNMFCKYNSRVSAEMLDEKTYNLDNGEFKQVTTDYLALETYALRQYMSLPDEYRDAYKELILLPVQMMANLYDMYYSTAMNHKTAKDKDLNVNYWADRVNECFNRDSILCYDYNHKVALGKWNHMMDQVHIGYSKWDAPSHNIIPNIYRLDKQLKSERGYIFNEKNKVVVMEAEHYNNSILDSNVNWQIIPDLGRTLSGVALMPYTKQPLKSSLTYKMKMDSTSKEVKIHIVTGATLPFNKTGLRFAISFDGEQEQICNFNSDCDWAHCYTRIYPVAAARIIESIVDVKIPNKSDTMHTLVIHPLDPGIVFEKIIIDDGGYEKSYLYMNESPYSINRN